jgi:hypothetical protein
MIRGVRACPHHPALRHQSDNLTERRSPGGIRELPGRGISMQMDVLVESIFPMTANALDTLIGGVEVERLAGVQLTTLPTGPPADDPRNEHDDVFDSIRRRQVRLMAGL